MLVKTRLLEFDYLRALAIILIVFGHSVYNTEKGFPLLLENLLRGGTAVFVFISGFFLHAVFARNFELRSFMWKKVKNVLVPFLVVSAVGLACRLFGWIVLLDYPAEKVLLNTYYTVKNFYVLYPHWYIPFIMLVFLLSPLYLAFLRLPVGRQLLLFALFVLLSLFLHRPHGNVNQIQSILYYTPFYLLGMLYSQHRAWFEARMGKVLVLSAILVVGALLLQTYVWVWVGNYHKWFFEYKGVDLQFVQKMGLCMLLLGWSRYLAARPVNPWLKEMGDLSFAIFFLHPLFTLLMENIFPLLGWMNVPGGALFSTMMTLLVFSIHFFGSFYTARIIRRLWPDKSRWLIGS
ncbi:acyltransferase family protein [Balneatrix alpica]|uniref:acyltransferase family protein n=1 Tax=Balneatrix alpica TaxID=75684 RepID=UPI00273A23F7|nr:acyltransferase [Balneatrix alpica]